MDFLQIALIFLMLLLSVFLTITGIQVFFILRDLKKALDRLNRVLQTGEEIAEDLEKPVAAASGLITTLGAGAKALRNVVKREKKKVPNNRRFYKKVL
ncbi:hypothetical protein HYS96_01360 [Candidatus Daviesbacteria bacterium]|nr:hypothetical protein [Candidatus Daviesbacteria bacterium]